MSSLLCEEGTLGVTGASSLSLNSCLLSAPHESINDLTRDSDFSDSLGLEVFMCPC